LRRATHRRNEGRTGGSRRKAENAGARPKDRPIPGYQQDDQATDSRTSDSSNAPPPPRSAIELTARCRARSAVARAHRSSRWLGVPVPRVVHPELRTANSAAGVPVAANFSVQRTVRRCRLRRLRRDLSGPPTARTYAESGISNASPETPDDCPDSRQSAHRTTVYSVGSLRALTFARAPV
jgi:hypothetical protein